MCCVRGYSEVHLLISYALPMQYVYLSYFYPLPFSYTFWYVHIQVLNVSIVGINLPLIQRCINPELSWDPKIQKEIFSAKIFEIWPFLEHFQTTCFHFVEHFNQISKIFREISKIFREMSIELGSRRPGSRFFCSADFKYGFGHKITL